MSAPFADAQTASAQWPAAARKFKRRCLICRHYFERHELFRIVKTSAGVYVVYAPETSSSDSRESRSAQGRSAYVCTAQACRQKIHLQKGRAVSHALKVSLSLSVLEAITNTLQTSP